MSGEGAAPKPSDRAGGPPVRRGWVSPFSLTLIACLGSGAVLFVFSYLRILQLEAGTWDLGIYQQALFSGLHGRGFYEAADFETGGFGSFLQVHSALILFALAPLYGAAPFPATLIALQSVIVAAAGIPLFFLARQITGSPWKGFTCALLFLAGAATLSSGLYDFHVEAFIPLEYFLFLLFYERSRYFLAAAVAAASFLTMESMPLLLFATGLFYAVPPLWDLLVRRRSRTLAAGPRLPSPLRRLVPPAVLLGGSAIAYFLLYLLRTQWVSPWLGVRPFPTGAVAAGYIIGAEPTSLGLAWGNLEVAFYAKLTYWVFLYALVGFVPLLAPRAGILAAPWVVFTLFSADTNLTLLGFQYGFIAGPPLFVGMAYGLRRVDSTLLSRLLLRPSSAPRPNRGPFRPRPSGVEAVWVLPLTGLVLFNLLASPVNPALAGSGLGAAYQVSYSTPGGYDQVARLAHLVPSNASVLASDLLFPFVANDLLAYSFHWGPDPNLALPFDPTRLPEFVLLAESRLGAVPPWLAPLLYNSSDYGTRGSVYSSPVGGVLLFEAGYAGPALVLGAPAPGPIVLTPGEFDLGAAYRLSDPTAPYGTSLASSPQAEGLLWQGPYGTLSGGRYLVTLYLKAWSSGAGAPPVNASTSVLSVNANAFGQDLWFSQTVQFGQLTGGTYRPIPIPIDVPALSVGVEFRFYALTPAVGVGFAGIELVPTGA